MSSRYRALIVHDDALVRARLRGQLAANGWMVMDTASHAVCMDLSKRHAPDIILIDVTTPWLHSDRLARLLKSDPVTCTIPLIALCAMERPIALTETWALDTMATGSNIPTILAKLKNAVARQRARRPYVLVVDDEPDLVELMTTAFAQEGFVASGASNGLEALEIIRTVQPDAIVLDLDMPMLNGWDFLSEAHNGPGLGTTRVIILTGADQTLEDRQHGFKLGACNYLLKPCDPSEVIRAVQQALVPPITDKRHGQNEHDTHR